MCEALELRVQVLNIVPSPAGKMCILYTYRYNLQLLY